MKKLSRRSLLKAAPAAAALGLALGGGAKADQPRMKAALDALRTAQRELEAATDDKGGHRVAAMRLVRQAIVQVEKGIAFDRRH